MVNTALVNNQSSKGIYARLPWLPGKCEARPYLRATSKPQRLSLRLRCDSQLHICQIPNIFIPHRKHPDAVEEHCVLWSIFFLCFSSYPLFILHR